MVSYQPATKQPGVLVDSGCTSHVFSDKDYFIHWDTNYNIEDYKIVLADGTTCDINGKGKVLLQTRNTNGEIVDIILHDCLYFPSLNYPGIYSVDKATEEENCAIFSKGESFITTGQGDKIPLNKRQNMYFINACKTVKNKSRTAMEWHNIFMHLNIEDILKLPKLTKGIKIKLNDAKQCRTCIQAKTKKKNSKTPDERSVENFAFIHSDIAGPLADNGFRFIITFVDDCSGYVFLYAIKNRDQCVQAFEQFLASVRRFSPPGATHSPVTRLRTDNAKEYMGQDFQLVCRREKIHHETSPPHTPSANGQAERLFGVLRTRASAALIDAKNVPASLWHKAYKYAAYLINRSPNINTGMTPYEKVFGKKPDCTPLAKFGAECEALNPHPTHKLAPRTQSGTFVGFDDHSDAYLVYFPSSRTTRAVNRVIIIDSDCAESQENSQQVIREIQENSQEITNNNEQFPQIPENTIDNEYFDFEGFETNNIQIYDINNSNVNNINDIRFNRMECDMCDYNVNKMNFRGDNAGHVNFGENSLSAYAFNCYNFSVHVTPKSFAQAMSSSEADQWWAAMKVEYNSLVANNCFDYVKRPTDVKVIPAMWVFALKREVDGSTRYKARWV